MNIFELEVGEGGGVVYFLETKFGSVESNVI